MTSPLSTQVLGIGGGGSMYDPQISPTNGQLMFVACDGSGLYRSDDRGTTWRLVDGRMAQGYGVGNGLGLPTLGFSVAFHPTDPTKLLAVRPSQGLKLSPDGGLTWPRFPQVVTEPAAFALANHQVTAAAFDEGNHLAVAVYDNTTTPSGTTLFVFDGMMWTSSAAYASKFVSRLVAVKDTTGKKFFFAALNDLTPLNDDILRFDGSNWTSITTGNGFPTSPKRTILGLAGSSDASGFAVYATVDTDPGGTDTTQIVKFTGNAWISAMGNLQALAGYYYEHLAMPYNDTQTVYLSGFNPPSLSPPNVWVTTNGGGSWTGIYDGYFADTALNVKPEGWNEVDFNWGFGGPALGLCVDPSNSQNVMLTNKAVVHMTNNGRAMPATAVVWQQSYTANPAMLAGKGLNWTSIGLEVTTTWDYVVSGTNHFILYTDIGLARSSDGGFSWTSAAKDTSGQSWGNWYQMISVGGQLFAAVSELHDLPFNEDQWNNGHHGAVLTSTDNGVTWSRLTATGLPTGLPVTSLAFNTVKNLPGVVGKSLLACVWDQAAPGQGGVYHSENMGSSWSGPLPGITSSTAPARCYRVLFDDNDDLYCVVSLPGGNVYRWDPNGTPSPQFIQVPGLATTVFTYFGGQQFFHPLDLTTRKLSTGKIELYLGTLGVQHGNYAMLYKFDGVSWNTLNVPVALNYGPSPSFFGAYFHDPYVYATSIDNSTWAAPIEQVDGVNAPNPTWVELDLPFLRTHRVIQSSVDKSLFVSTFGYGMMRVAPELISYFFAIFRRLQVLGIPAPAMTTGSEPFATQNGGINWIGTSTADTPLYMVLKDTAGGGGSFQYPAGTGPTWNPVAPSAAWTDLGGQALTNAVAEWLPEWVANGKNAAIPQIPNVPTGPIMNPDTSNVPVAFVCSDPADDGTRPGIIQQDFWNHSVIALFDKNTGLVASAMATLHAADEWWVAAAIGNRGNVDGGKYAPGVGDGGPSVQAQAWALAFGTGGSTPGVQLPSLENLDPTSKNGIFEVYQLPKQQYQLVGFRLNVKNTFDGLVAALKRLGNSITLGSSPEDWLRQSSHVCIRVAVSDNGLWPAFDASPLQERRIAQKNLVPFDMDLSNPSPIPNVVWKNFLVGPLNETLRDFVHDPDVGRYRLVLHTSIPQELGTVMLAIPRSAFERFIDREGIRGFQIVEEPERERFNVPFTDQHVVLISHTHSSAIALPRLGSNVVGMSLGFELKRDRLSVGQQAHITVEQRATVPQWIGEQRCYSINEVPVGGITVRLHIHDDARDVDTEWESRATQQEGRRSSRTKSRHGKPPKRTHQK